MSAARPVDNGIYDRIASTWWDDDGFMALLRTSVNPGRSAYFRKVLLERLLIDPGSTRLLDVGCGGGLLAEEFARLGCLVTGVDRSQPTLEAARAHAQRSTLAIDYVEGSAESLPFPSASFDVVSCCDVLEHVDDPSEVLEEIARVLKPGGVFVFDTINRTWRSKLIAIKLAQDWPTRFIPADVHVWEKFIRPAELSAAMAAHGLHASEFVGLAPPKNPLPALAAFARLKLGILSFGEFGERLRLEAGSDLSVSYMGFALRSRANRSN
jgi:2-polyprenyl-6-hydroxyphenyl methylase/3-demethylubiquinone-9 3-methyltransferase